MQTYDGASAMPGYISGVQTLVRGDYPFAYFFHCAAHCLNLVLCQSASSIPLVRVFFANVAAFSTFASNSPRRICCIQMELIYLSLEKLGGTIVHIPSVFFVISTKPF